MGRGVVVTGGAHGIGKQICLDFLNEGDKVCFIDIDEKRSSDFIKEHPNNLFCFHGDVADPSVLNKFIEYALEKLQRIDVLVNNACRGNKGILSGLTYEEFDYTLSVGLKAPFELSRLCRDELIKNKGRIINIASTRAFQSEPDTEAYASAKGGIVALTYALAMSLAPHVLVNCIAPGWINVTDNDDFSPEDRAAVPAGRVGTPKDISDMVLFLCRQDFITGETFVVDGGMSKRMIYHGDWNWFYKV